jgi:recombinational DNA repair protein RecR
MELVEGEAKQYSLCQNPQCCAVLESLEDDFCCLACEQEYRLACLSEQPADVLREKSESYNRMYHEVHKLEMASESLTPNIDKMCDRFYGDSVTEGL